MSDLFKGHANAVAIYTAETETQLLFMLKRPIMTKDMKIELQDEETALLTLSFETARKLRDSLDRNIKEHEENLKKRGEVK